MWSTRDTTWRPWERPDERSPLEKITSALRRAVNKRAINPLVLVGAGVIALSIAWLLNRRLGSDDEGEDRRRAVAQARVKHFEAKPSRRRRSPPRPPSEASGASSSRNWMTSPDRYVPPPDETDKHLQVHGERVLLRDGAHSQQPASALLDTGNSALTVVDEAYARRHGLYADRGVFAAPHEWTTLRGVNPGAETRAPVVITSLTLRGREFKQLRVAVSPLPGDHDVLVGLDVLRPLFAEGFVLTRV